MTQVTMHFMRDRRPYRHDGRMDESMAWEMTRAFDEREREMRGVAITLSREETVPGAMDPVPCAR